MKNILYLISFVSIVTCGFGCRKSNRFVIDTASEKIEVQIKRFDVDLIQADTSNIESALNQLFVKYPTFMPVYVSRIIDVDINDKTKQKELIHGFLTDTAFQAVNKKVMDTFSDVSAIEASLSNSYGYIHHYFPDLKLPEIYFFVSGFNQSIIFADNIIAIGADLYLGSDYPKYKSFSYAYLLIGMQPNCIAADVISALLFKSFPIDIMQDRLLDNMLYRGKLMYLLSVVMPQQEPYELMGYTKMQWEWSRKYEKDIWETIVDRKDLYSTDMMLTRKYLNDAPFTTPISQDSPGRLGTWIGWQIIASYMDNNKNVSLTDLIKENNYQKILDNSDYNP